MRLSFWFGNAAGQHIAAWQALQLFGDRDQRDRHRLHVAFDALPSIPVVVGLVVIALLTGFELRVDARAPVSPMVSALVVAAAVVGGDGAFGGVVVVAVIATATAWVVRGNAWWAPVFAAGAAAASAIVFDARPSRAGALAAAIVFEVVVVTRMGHRVDDAVRCAAIALAYGWDAINARAVVFGGVTLACAAAAWCATVGECVLGRWGAARDRLAPPHPVDHRRTRRRARRRRGDGDVGPGGAGRAGGVGGAGLNAMAMVGVRPWRFSPVAGPPSDPAPRVLARDLLAYPPVAARGDAGRWRSSVELAVSAAVAGRSLGVDETPVPPRRAQHAAR